jgi:hypothetical protein
MWRWCEKRPPASAQSSLLAGFSWSMAETMVVKLCECLSIIMKSGFDQTSACVMDDEEETWALSLKSGGIDLGGLIERFLPHLHAECATVQ